jgi:hypothetical protein
MRELALLVLLGTLVGCTATVTTETPPSVTPPSPDAPARACVNLRRLKCAAGSPTPGGATCETVLRDAVHSGITGVDPECLARIDRCEDEARCSGGVP